MLKIKWPWRKQIEAREKELEAANTWAGSLFDECDRMRKEMDDLAEENASMREQILDQQKNGEFWHKRWMDEHEKYVDLCHEVTECAAHIKIEADTIRASAMIDT